MQLYMSEKLEALTNVNSLSNYIFHRFHFHATVAFYDKQSSGCMSSRKEHARRHLIHISRLFDKNIFETLIVSTSRYSGVLLYQKCQNMMKVARGMDLCLSFSLAGSLLWDTGQSRTWTGHDHVTLPQPIRSFAVLCPALIPALFHNLLRTLFYAPLPTR